MDVLKLWPLLSSAILSTCFVYYLNIWEFILILLVMIVALRIYILSLGCLKISRLCSATHVDMSLDVK